MKLAVATIMVLGVLGPDCGGNAPESETPAGLGALKALEDEIDGMIGSAACGDSSDCAYVGFGAKPCGGPWKYKIYSESTVNAAVFAKIDAYHALNDSLNRALGLVSDCSIASPPELECRDGHCVDAGASP
jgi:hypothetical protein